MNVRQITSCSRQGVIRLEYQSSIDGIEDWALVNPPKNFETWIVCIHGHGSHGDQLYTRQDIRDRWLGVFLDAGYGILTPNLRDNAWMAPNAAEDLRTILDHLRRTYQARQFIFASGSMGGTSNLIYAVLHPEDVAAVVSLGAASDLASYTVWCRTIGTGIVKEIADTIESAYGGVAQQRSALYKKHSALENVSRLTMPVFLAHGEADEIIPVEQSRLLAEKMVKCDNFIYREIPEGNHDSPLELMADAIAWIKKHF
ncbi:MAG: prolyl oligopeptidase family serine peptidase [Phycisphaerae bacterium]|nr:prolyl oligopeptidase family serine peptidase [Phycisphaerae bacterium]